MNIQTLQAYKLSLSFSFHTERGTVPFFSHLNVNRKPFDTKYLHKDIKLYLHFHKLLDTFKSCNKQLKTNQFQG